MRYANIRKAVFERRPNRFIAEILLDGRKEICHVKNTGRCRELLLPGREIFVQDFSGEAAASGRKTCFDLIAVRKGCRLINIDSQAPNKAAAELWPKIIPSLSLLCPEKQYGDSRLDFYAEAPGRKIFAEVKGVTLEKDGVALFPDAPTERGTKHLSALCRAVEEGMEAYLLFLIQMDKVAVFRPNAETDCRFAAALKRAAAAGVKLLAYDCLVTPDSLTAKSPVKIDLE